MRLPLDGLGIVSLLEELACARVSPVPDLCVALRDALDESAEGRGVQGSQEEVDVIVHQAERVHFDRAAPQAIAEQPDEELVVPGVGEETPSVVATQDDMVRHTFENLPRSSWHARSSAAWQRCCVVAIFGAGTSWFRGVRGVESVP